MAFAYADGGSIGKNPYAAPKAKPKPAPLGPAPTMDVPGVTNKNIDSLLFDPNYTAPSAFPSGSTMNVPGVTTGNIGGLLFDPSYTLQGGPGTNINPFTGDPYVSTPKAIPPPGFRDLVSLDPQVIAAIQQMLRSGQGINNSLKTQLQQGLINLGDRGIVDAVNKAAASIGYNGIGSSPTPELQGIFSKLTAGMPLNFALDPATGDLAQKATEAGLSQIGQVNYQEDQARKALVDTLASRGVLDSGHFHYMTNDQLGHVGPLTQQFATQRYNTDQSALQNFTGLIANALQQQEQLASQVQAAQQYAFGLYNSDPVKYAASIGS